MTEQPYDDVVHDATSDVPDDDDERRELAVATVAAQTAVTAPRDFSREQLELIKATVARGTSDLEFKLFIEVCRLTGLNPFAHQIYAIMRNNREQDDDGAWRSVKRMTIQTGIDGYLAIASRTHEFAGMDDVVFDTEEGEHPNWARVTVYRLVQGQRMPFTATARWREYVQTDSKGNPTSMWKKMGWTMLGKCGRALGLRLAFPAELGGVYTTEEMAQADNPDSALPGATVDTMPAQQRPQRVAQRARTATQVGQAGRNAAARLTQAHAQLDAQPADTLPKWGALGADAATLGLDAQEWQRTITAVTGKARTTDPQSGEIVSLAAQLTDDDKRKMLAWLEKRRQQFTDETAAPALPSEQPYDLHEAFPADQQRGA